MIIDLDFIHVISEMKKGNYEVNNLINRIATYTEMLLSFKPLELKYWLTEEDLQKIIKED